MLGQVPYARQAAFHARPRHASYLDAGVRAEQIRLIRDVVRRGAVFVLTGAGVSTDSGIPDYRGPHGVRRTTSPMTYQQFTDDPAARHRYWARSFVGWGTIARARPNACHGVVAAWEAAGLVESVVTQNVDGLHAAAGCVSTLELHGSLHRVVCLDCAATSARDELDVRLRAANPHLDSGRVAGLVSADGDAGVSDDVVAAFRMVPCVACGSERLKPDVVYFGENVPADRVRRARAALGRSRAVVVLGSSLTVMSGYRFVRDAHRAGKPVAIVNSGVTRGDEHATHQVDAPLQSVIEAWGPWDSA